MYSPTTHKKGIREEKFLLIKIYIMVTTPR
jgi:hypothetical protein